MGRSELDFGVRGGVGSKGNLRKGDYVFKGGWGCLIWLEGWRVMGWD